jgi:putative Holliday junction resolvase
MSKILGIDYGSKRTGLAITDYYNKIALGLKTVPTKNLMCFLHIYIYREDVKKIIIGLPKKLNNKEAVIELSIQKLIYNLNKKYPSISIERIDERFTSKLALNAILASGIKKNLISNL